MSDERTAAADHRASAASRLARIATAACRSLARIARAYDEYASGRCDAARVIEVVRQETQRASRQR